MSLEPSGVRTITPTQEQIDAAAMRVVHLLQARAAGETTMSVTDLTAADVLCTLEHSLTIIEALLRHCKIPLDMLALTANEVDPRA